MRKVLSVAVICLFAVSMFQSGAEGRAQYRGEFAKKYAKELGKTKVTCGACHLDGGKNKKKRNNYGAALGAAVVKKNQKDKAIIGKALDAAAKKESHIKGKSFGDLIKEGKLPGEPEKK